MIRIALIGFGMALVLSSGLLAYLLHRVWPNSRTNHVVSGLAVGVICLLISWWLESSISTALAMFPILLGAGLAFIQIKRLTALVSRVEGQSMEFARDVVEQIHVDEIRGEILRELLHDIRTPLTSIKGCSQAIASEPSMPEDVRKELLGIVVSESNALNDLITQLSGVSYGKLDQTQAEGGPRADFSAQLQERLRQRLTRGVAAPVVGEKTDVQ